MGLVGPVLADAAAGESPTVRYQAPVSGPIIDPYREPATPYGPGNRGVDYATVPGEVAGAAADGEVTFAGPVGGALHVVVLHADGIRTSLSFLASVLVRRGQQVVAGQPVGRTGSSLHFGARRGSTYLDPGTLLGLSSGPGQAAILVPDGPARPFGVDQEVAEIRLGFRGDRRIGLPGDPSKRTSGAVASAPTGDPAPMPQSEARRWIAPAVRGALPVGLVAASVAHGGWTRRGQRRSRRGRLPRGRP